MKARSVHALGDLSPLALELARKSAATFDAGQVQQRERRRFDRALVAAREGLAKNPTWRKP